MSKSDKDFVTEKRLVKVAPGEMIRTLRNWMDWTQEDLAKKSGISATNISALENGRLKVGRERAIALGEAFRVHPATIMFADYVAKNKPLREVA